MRNQLLRLALVLSISLGSLIALSGSGSARQTDEIEDLQATVEALEEEISDLQIESIPEVAEIDQADFDDLVEQIKADDPIFGPEDGEILQDPSFIRVWYAVGQPVDFLLEATLGNPWSEDEGPFDFGAEIRIHGDYLNASRIYLIIDSDGNWMAAAGTDDQWSNEEETTLGEGRYRRVDTDEGGENTLTVIAIGQEVHFAINGDYVSSFGVPYVTAGSLAIGTGFFSGNTIEDGVTPFSDYAVWEV